MNHLKSMHKIQDREVIPYHSWEIRQGAYKRTAVIFSCPFWKSGNDRPLVDFLLNRSFRAVEVESGFWGSSLYPARQESFETLVSEMKDFIRHQKETYKIPVYVFAYSLQSALVLRCLDDCPDVEAVFFIGPVFSGHKDIKVPFWPWSKKALWELRKEDLSAKPEILEEAYPTGDYRTWLGRSAVRGLHASASRTAALLKACADARPTIILQGEEDPLARPQELEVLAGNPKVVIKTYPRSKNLPAWDKYSGNYYGDMGDAVDRVEAGWGD